MYLIEVTVLWNLHLGLKKVHVFGRIQVLQGKSDFHPKTCIFFSPKCKFCKTKTSIRYIITCRFQKHKNFFCIMNRWAAIAILVSKYEVLFLKRPTLPHFLLVAQKWLLYTSIVHTLFLQKPLILFHFFKLCLSKQGTKGKKHDLKKSDYCSKTCI